MGKRRILTVVLAMIVAFGLAACGGGNKPAEMLADEETEKIQVQNYPASLETTNTSWIYTIDLGSFTEGLNLYVFSSGYHRISWRNR